MRAQLGKMARILGWIIGGLFLLVAIAYALLLLINRHDSEPSAAFTALTRASLDRPIPEETDNGYVFFMGFSSPPSADVLAEGRKNIADINAWLEKGKGRFYEKKAERAVSDVLHAQPETVGDILSACGHPRKDCVQRLFIDHNAISHLIEGHPWILQRYQTLISKPQWREISRYTSMSFFPYYSDVTDTQKIFLLQAWIDAYKGNTRAAARAVEMDHIFWRTVLANTDSLVTSMIAVSALRRNYVLGSLALVAEPRSAEPAAPPPSWSQEISRSDRSLLKVYGGEVNLSSDLFKNAKESGFVFGNASDDVSIAERLREKLLIPLIKPQDTMNFYAGKLMENEQHFSAPLDKYLALIISRYEQEDDWHLSLYNPVGRMLILTGGNAYVDYYPRLSDLEGARRLALLTLTLHRQHTALKDMPAAIAGSTLRDPYNNKAFEWDGEAGFLKFRGLQRNAENASFEFFYRP